MTNEPGMLQVVLMGMITVFVVLICIIGIITVMGKIMVAVTGKQQASAPAAPAAPAAQPVGNKQQLVAVIAAAIAEEMGESVDHIRIHSIRKL